MVLSRLSEEYASDFGKVARNLFCKMGKKTWKFFKSHEVYFEQNENKKK